MLVPVCYFRIWFLTAAARNIDSAFANYNYTAVLCVNLFMLLQDMIVPTVSYSGVLQ